MIQQDFAAIMAKSEVNGCSMTVNFREKDIYSSYTPLYMIKNQPIFLRTLGVAHIVVAIILLPLNLFLGFFSIPIFLPAQIWLAILGFQLWRPNPKLQARLCYTHFVLAPFAILLVAYEREHDNRCAHFQDF